MEEFPANNRTKKTAAQPTEKKVVKVISGTVVRKKQSPGTRFKRLFITGEDSRSVFEYMFTEHIRPGIRDLVYDAVTGGMHQKFYPGQMNHRRQVNSPVSNGLGMLTNYASISRGPAGPIAPEPRVNRRARSNHYFGDMVFPTKPEAEIVLETMYEIVTRHDECTVADFLQMVGETPEFTDEKWGWTGLEGARVRRAPAGGYVIDLPATEALA